MGKFTFLLYNKTLIGDVIIKKLNLMKFVLQKLKQLEEERQLFIRIMKDIER